MASQETDEIHQDEVDVQKIFSFRKKDKSSIESSTEAKTRAPISKSEISKIPAVNDDYYNMRHEKRGIALIFNHFYFDSAENTPRNGTDIDCKRINQTLQSLKFETKIYDDLKYGAIVNVLKQVASSDHSNSDSLVIVVMTHGDPNTLHARDGEYYIRALWEPFTGEKCPTLAGKPKLFFIQACRGDKTDSGVQVELDGPTLHSETLFIPSLADILFMFPTQTDHFSFRSPNNGSWFIQSLCDELDERSKHQDLMTILTFVNRRIAFNFQSFIPQKAALHQKKQVGSIVSSLTRLVHFHQ